MRRITIEDGLTLRFPGRDAAFAEGVEIGVLATLMALGRTEIARPIAPGNLGQARALAEALGYRLLEVGRSADGIDVLVTRGSARPALRVIAGGRWPA